MTDAPAFSSVTLGLQPVTRSRMLSNGISASSLQVSQPANGFAPSCIGIIHRSRWVLGLFSLYNKNWPSTDQLYGSRLLALRSSRSNWSAPVPLEGLI